ncbi:MAG: hypothetical protein WAW36_19165 [Methylovulum miyakonense]
MLVALHGIVRVNGGTVAEAHFMMIWAKSGQSLSITASTDAVLVAAW